MDEQSLSLSFGDSLSEDVASIVGEYAELGLDALVEEGLLKDIPIVSTAVAVYRIGKSIREKHHISKLISFLNEINKGIADEEKREQYREKFNSNEKFRNQELEYILLITDRYIGFQKPQMLAKLYLEYLDGSIDWIRFTEYAEIIDRLLASDYECLLLLMCHDGIDLGEISVEIASVLRLLAVGFVTQEQPAVNALLGMDGPRDSMDYLFTDYGRRFAEMLESYIRANHRMIHK